MTLQAKTAKWTFGLLLSIAASMAVTACGGGGGSSSPTVSVLPDGTISGVNCPTGQVYTAVTGCTAATAYTSGTYQGSVQSLNRSMLESMLSTTGRCGGMNFYYDIGSGKNLASCSTYSSQAFVVVQISGNYAQATLYAGNSSPYSSNGVPSIPISMAGTMNPINNSTSYVIQSGNGLQLYLDTASMAGASLPAHITYQGTTLGTITLTH